MVLRPSKWYSFVTKLVFPKKYPYSTFISSIIIVRGYNHTLLINYIACILDISEVNVNREY